MVQRSTGCVFVEKPGPQRLHLLHTMYEKFETISERKLKVLKDSVWSFFEFGPGAREYSPTRKFGKMIKKRLSKLTQRES